MYLSPTIAVDANVEGPYNGYFHRQTGHGKMKDLASEVLRLRDDGWGVTKIARHIRKRNQFVIGIIRKAEGEGGTYYLTEGERARARELRLLGWSATSIASDLGRSKKAIAHHLRMLKLHKRQLRPIEVNGDVTVVTLTRGQKSLIDTADLPLVKGRSWFALGAAGRFYAATRSDEGVVITMHRFLMKPPPGMHVDHIDGNSLDNRRSCNLRLATPQQNTVNARRNRSNRTGFIGVQKHKSGKFWASIVLNLGTFPTAEEAAHAYDTKATELFGEFAMTNKKRGLLA
jgi:hypothetical protein